jgi:hypothetical protein
MSSSPGISQPAQSLTEPAVWKVWEQQQKLMTSQQTFNGQEGSLPVGCPVLSPPATPLPPVL